MPHLPPKPPPKPTPCRAHEYPAGIFTKDSHKMVLAIILALTIGIVYGTCIFSFMKNNEARRQEDGKLDFDLYKNKKLNMFDY